MLIRHALTIGSCALLGLSACGNSAAPTGDAAFDTSFEGDVGARLIPAAAQAATGAAGPTGGAQTLDIVDRQSFGQPISAATITVPAGWRAEGGVGWNRADNCVTNQLKFQWRATSPDGAYAFELIPGYSWQLPQSANQFNPCPVAGMTSVRDFLTAAARQLRPGARVLNYRDRDDVPANAQGGGRQAAGEIILAYDFDGRPVHEQITALASFSGGGGLVSYMSAVRAPAGKLDPKLGERIRGSMKANQQYWAMASQAGTQQANSYAGQQSQAISSWHAGRMADINARGAADRAAIRSQTNREVSQIYADTNAGTSAANDRMYENTRQALNQESAWTNPSTGQKFQGSIHGGRRVIQLDDGSTTRTDDPYYNPSGSVELEPQG